VKNRFALSLVAALGVVALLTGCSPSGSEPDPPKNGSEAPQVEESEAAFSLPPGGAETPWGIPSEIGEYKLLSQFGAQEAGLCRDQIPILLDEEEESWYVLYANDAATQELAQRNAGKGTLPQCSWVSPDSSDPYDEKLVGLVQIFVSLNAESMAIDPDALLECLEDTENTDPNCGETDRTKDQDECKSWDDEQYTSCGRVVGSTGAIYNANGNFESGAEGEKILSAFVDIFVEHFEYTPQPNGAPW